MKLTLLEKVLKSIAAREISRRDAAVELECSERQVNRLMRRYSVTRPASPIPDMKEAARERRRAQKKLIEKAIAQNLPPEKIADLAGVSLRTVYRYRAAKGLVKTRKKRTKVRKIG